MEHRIACSGRRGSTFFVRGRNGLDMIRHQDSICSSMPVTNRIIVQLGSDTLYNYFLKIRFNGILLTGIYLERWSFILHRDEF